MQLNEITELIKMCRDNGILEFKSAEVEFKLQPASNIPSYPQISMRDELVTGKVSYQANEEFYAAMDETLNNNNKLLAKLSDSGEAAVNTSEELMDQDLLYYSTDYYQEKQDVTETPNTNLQD
jgi:hypothetical protein